jgi:hypothetical protein
MVDVATYSLEMTAASALRPKYMERSDLTRQQAHVLSLELHWLLYAVVGGDWYWIDRLTWTYKQWLDWLDRPVVQTRLAYLAGTPAGYFALEAQAEGNVEIGENRIYGFHHTGEVRPGVLPSTFQHAHVIHTVGSFLPTPLYQGQAATLVGVVRVGGAFPEG